MPDGAVNKTGLGVTKKTRDQRGTKGEQGGVKRKLLNERTEGAKIAEIEEGTMKGNNQKRGKGC